jgi:hypothetical protein
MQSVHLGDIPDYLVILNESDGIEIVIGEISRFFPRSGKGNYDWKKINRECKNGFDVRKEELIKGKNLSNDEGRSIIDDLHQIPFIGIQVIRNDIIVFGIDSYKNSFYRSFEIIKYNIPLRLSNGNIIKEFLTKSLIVKNYVDKMVSNLLEIRNRIMNLPDQIEDEIDEIENSECNMSIATTY